MTLFVAGIFVLFVNLVRSSDVYSEAMLIAKTSDSVKKITGSPMQAGYLVNGTITVNGPAGNAQLSIPTSGPEGKAVLLDSTFKCPLGAIVNSPLRLPLSAS